jgi:hypothetical protein
MKYTIYILALTVFSLVFCACKKEHDFIRDNTTPTGVGSTPVSTNALLDVGLNKSLGTTSGAATVYAAGASFKTELQYFSESPVKEINLYNTIGAGTRTKVSTIPYAAAFSNIKKLDTLLVPYTVPAAPSSTVIKLEYEILNQNTLNVLRTVYVKVQ